MSQTEKKLAKTPSKTSYKELITYLAISPAPSILMALASYAGCWYWGWPLYKFAFGYTGVILTLGGIMTVVSTKWASRLCKNDPSSGFVFGLAFLAPGGISFLKLFMYWSTLYSIQDGIHQLSLFTNFLTRTN